MAAAGRPSVAAWRRGCEVDLEQAPRDDVCVWAWRQSRSNVTSSTFGCLHRRSKGIWSVGVASWWLPGGGSSGGGDYGLAAEMGEDATIAGGARGCRFTRWRR